MYKKCGVNLHHKQRDIACIDIEVLVLRICYHNLQYVDDIIEGVLAKTGTRNQNGLWH